MLNDKADEVIDVGIDSLTVTVNAVDPEIEAMINARIFYHGKTYTGVEAAEILIHNQLEGIRKVIRFFARALTTSTSKMWRPPCAKRAPSCTISFR